MTSELTCPPGLPPSSKVDVWTFELDVPEVELARMAPLLSPDEIERSRSFVFPLHADRYKAAHGRLREVLSERLGAPPQDITFLKEARGKPYVAKPETDLRFNLSHSGDMAVVAVAPAEVGIDIEFVKALSNPAELEGALSPNEQKALAALEGRQRLEAFYRCWTRKEALIKAVGLGLGASLESFDVPVSDEPETIVSFDPPERAGRIGRWRLVSFEPKPGIIGAVAFPAEWNSASLSVNFHRWPVAV